MKNKKGQVMSGINGLMVALAAIVIIVAVTFLILANVITQVATVGGVDPTNAATFTTAYNATLTLQQATATIPGWVPLIVIATIGGLILLLVRVFR